jgi:hypothetical protein
MKKMFSVAAVVVSTALGSFSAVAQPVDVAAEKYVKLVLALGQHDAGYVDAYYGPAPWAQESKAAKADLGQIISRAKTLQNLLPPSKQQNDEMAQLRLHYLDKQLTALITHAQALSGETTLSFDAQSAALYDTQAPHYKLSDFDHTLAELEKMLPGKGELYQRVADFKQQFEIPKERLSEVFNRAIKECRDRTKVFVDLLDNESFTLEYVKKQPWSAYNWYKGNALSLIQVNTDFPTQLSRAVDLGCHEGYPGHHAYNALLEDKLVKQRGWVEYSVYPLYSPQSLIAEGSANYGIVMAFPGNEKFEFEKQVLFPLAGLDPKLAESYEKYNELAEKLAYAGNEIARSYINGDIDKEQAITLTQKYKVSTRARAEQSLSFVETYGAYVINYNWGKDMVKNYIEQADSQKSRWQRFAQLLSTPRIPSSLNW